METDLTIIRGDTCTLTLKKTAEGVEVPFETGDTFIFSAKKKLKQTTYDIQSDTFVIIDGEAIITLSSTDTDIREGDYCYDIQYTDVDGDIYTLIRGTLTIDWNVTANE